MQVCTVLRDLAWPASRLITDVKGHLETIMCVFRNGLPTHSPLKCSRSHTALRDPPLPVPATIHPTLFALLGAPPLTHRQRRNFLFLSFSADPFSIADPPPPCQKQCLPQCSSNSSALLLDHCLDPELVKKRETLLKTHTHTHILAKMWVRLIIPC